MVIDENAAESGPAENASNLPWRDVRRTAAERVDDLLSRMTLEEKVAQLYGVWVGADADGLGVAPHQHDLAAAPDDWHALISAGLGQLTRPFGTAPVDPAFGARSLASAQAQIVAAGRHGIPAVAHDECLTGFMAWGATVYPTSLAWGASFDPDLVEQMSVEIGRLMRSVGIHQGLGPVLDVTRDYRWGRVEETIGEDPYLVATIGTAYVRGLESAGVIATLKHFLGYSASRGGRNFGPIAMGPRELHDVMAFPFEMAVRDGGARSIMHAYTEIDGVPGAANKELLGDLLRDRWQFEGTVVADYFGITFLRTLHKVAENDDDAAVLALEAGVDVELPTLRCYAAPLIAAVHAGKTTEAMVDRAARRVLLQKCALGLLDAGWSPIPPALRDAAGGTDSTDSTIAGSLDFDPPASRATARRLAEESIVLVSNSGLLPLESRSRIALVGPRAGDVFAMLGCYTFPSHVGPEYPDRPIGIDIATLRQACEAEFGADQVTYAEGCAVDVLDTTGFAAATAVAAAADVCVVAVGDSTGLFGRGTSGEGCDAESLQLPGVQQQLVEALLETGTPVVIVVISGRPYALGTVAERAAAIVQAFFPGEEGAGAIAGVLSGRVCPSGRLPVGIPRGPGGQPATYLTVPLGMRTEVSSVDPTPLWPFGHGLSYTSFEWDPVRVAVGRSEGAGSEGDAVVTGTDGSLRLSLTVRNTGDRVGAEIVQLYLHDPLAQVTRPVVRLIGYGRVELSPRQEATLVFEVSADLSAFTGLAGQRIVEPGDLEIRLSTSSATVLQRVRWRLEGEQRAVGFNRIMATVVTVA